MWLILQWLDDSGKAKKKKRGFFGTVRNNRTKEDEDISPTQSPSDKRGFANKLKNLFKFKRKTSPKPSRKNIGESVESESADLTNSDSEDLSGR